MGNATILYGYIEGVDAGDASEMNVASVSALPREDSWPYLTFDLFSVPRLEHTYNQLLVTFGTVYQNLFPESGWPEWRAKFEALLRTLSWYQAHVYLDIELMGRFHFTWTQDVWHPSDYDLPNDTKRALAAIRDAFQMPTEKWIFSGGPVEKNES